MGLWWKRADELVVSDAAINFEGDHTSLSKSWPLLWRRGQNWHGLDFGANQMDSPDEGYELFYRSGEKTMVFRRIITERYVMVRIGEESVMFWARSVTTRKLLRPKKLEIVVPSVFAALRGADISIAYKRIQNLTGRVVWV